MLKLNKLFKLQATTHSSFPLPKRASLARVSLQMFSTPYKSPRSFFGKLTQWQVTSMPERVLCQGPQSCLFSDGFSVNTIPRALTLGGAAPFSHRRCSKHEHAWSRDCQILFLSGTQACGGAGFEGSRCVESSQERDTPFYVSMFL